MDINKEFSDKVKEIRKKLGLSQKQFGHLVGIHVQQISRYERGVDLPQARIRDKILAYDPPKEMVLLKVQEPKIEWHTDGSSPDRRQPHNALRRNFINKVLKILESGNQKAITALESNVEAFLEMSEVKGSEFEEAG